MKVIYTAILFLLVFPSLSMAQQPPFTEANTTLPQLAYSACAWGDYDHDGDLDLALTGAEGNDPVTRVLRNDAGTFTDLQSDLPAVHFGSVEWGDYDHDGDLDLLVTGMESQGTQHTFIAKNNAGIFTDAGISLPGIMDGQASWGDSDNDGDLDILMAGSLMAAVYRNDGNGTFTNIAAPFPNVETAMCCWNDYNNDGQADVLVCGYSGDGIFSKLFKNSHGTFTEVTIGPEPFDGLYGGQAKCADLDNDGDQDLVIAGMDVYVDGYFLVYRNEGNDQFTKFVRQSTDLLSPSIDLADFDNDGLTDIALIGTLPGCGGSGVTRLLKNLGNMDFFDVSSLLPGYKLGGVTWGDYNNDGYTDLLFTGLDAFEVPKTALYLNTLGNTSISVNTPPVAPGGLGATILNGKVMLYWNCGQDEQTPKNSLSYNIYIGTQPESSDMFSPLAFIPTGMRLVTAPGNTTADTNWIIAGIDQGTYYFSVQTIDNGFMSSLFASPAMFTFPSVGMGEPAEESLVIYPNPCKDKMRIRTPGFPKSGINGGKGDISLSVVNSTGQVIYRGSGDREINVSTWPSGIYLARCQFGNSIVTEKLVKE